MLAKTTKFVFVLLIAGCSPVTKQPANSESDESRMTLEKQIDTLATLGLRLNDGITVDDLLYSCDRASYEKEPFDDILFIYGIEVEREPWGRPFCSRVWNFDTECINETGDYVSIVKRICDVADSSSQITNIQDFVDMESGEAWLKYDVDGKSRKWTVEVNDDWADRMTISYVLNDIERDGNRFYYKENGQAMIMFYLDRKTAKELNRLTNNALKLVNPD